MKSFCKKRKHELLTPAQVGFVRRVYEDRGCAYCAKLRSAVSLWCEDEQAIQARHTAIPGVIHCPYWRPDKAYIGAGLKDIRENNNDDKK